MPATIVETVPQQTTAGIRTGRSIRDALREYDDACQLRDVPPFHEMVTVLIECGYDKDFKNDSFFDALCLTHTMLVRSLNSVKILTGSGGNFWEALEKPFAIAAERLSRTHGKIQMVVINATPDCIKALESMRLRFGSVFEYLLASGNSQISHFIVCDSKMVRLEEPHPPIDLDSPANVIKAKVNFKDTVAAERHENLFDSIWTRLQSARLPA